MSHCLMFLILYFFLKKSDPFLVYAYINIYVYAYYTHIPTHKHINAWMHTYIYTCTHREKDLE